MIRKATTIPPPSRIRVRGRDAIGERERKIILLTLPYCLRSPRLPSTPGMAYVVASQSDPQDGIVQRAAACNGCRCREEHMGAWGHGLGYGNGGRTRTHERKKGGEDGGLGHGSQIRANRAASERERERGRESKEACMHDVFSVPPHTSLHVPLP